MKTAAHSVREPDFIDFSLKLAGVFDTTPDATALIHALESLYPCAAAFAVLNRPDANPVYLADTFPDETSKAAVQLYVQATYDINPVHTAIQNGLCSGVFRMVDLAPDNWQATTAEVVADDSEEIGFRTPGWPAGLQEVSVLVDLSDGVVGEVSLAREAIEGGVKDEDLDSLRQFLPLIRSAFLRVASAQPSSDAATLPIQRGFDEFGKDTLSMREAEVLQLILKGHSSLSISLQLNIALPTVKSHRRNAYAKLGISTQQQLFRKYLDWRGA